MSRIGKLPVPIAKGVEVKQANGTVMVNGDSWMWLLTSALARFSPKKVRTTRRII